MNDQDFTIRVVSYAHVVVQGTDLRLHNVTRVGIMIGPWGPFYHDFDPPNDSADAINTWKIAKQSDIRAGAATL